jgi:hypothetical protein
MLDDSVPSQWDRKSALGTFAVWVGYQPREETTSSRPIALHFVLLDSPGTDDNALTGPIPSEICLSALVYLWLCEWLSSNEEERFILSNRLTLLFALLDSPEWQTTMLTIWSHTQKSVKSRHSNICICGVGFHQPRKKDSILSGLSHTLSFVLVDSFLGMTDNNTLTDPMPTAEIVKLFNLSLFWGYLGMSVIVQIASRWFTGCIFLFPFLLKAHRWFQRLQRATHRLFLDKGYFFYHESCRRYIPKQMCKGVL